MESTQTYVFYDGNSHQRFPVGTISASGKDAIGKEGNVTIYRLPYPPNKNKTKTIVVAIAYERRSKPRQEDAEL